MITGYLLKDTRGESPVWTRLRGPVRADGKVPEGMEEGLEYFVEVSVGRPTYDSRIQRLAETRTETLTEAADEPNQVVLTYEVQPLGSEAVAQAIRDESRAAIDRAITEDDQMRSLAAAVEILLVATLGGIVPELGVSGLTQEQREAYAQANLPPLLVKLNAVKLMEAERDAKLAEWENGTLPDLDSWP